MNYDVEDTPAALNIVARLARQLEITEEAIVTLAL